MKLTHALPWLLLITAASAQTHTAPNPSAPSAPARLQGPWGGLNFDFSQFENLELLDSFHGPLSVDLKLPHGTWWRDAELVKRIALSTDQQKRIEDLFLQNKIQLIHMHASLEEEELLLQPTLDGNPPDQTKALAQIGKIADTRADLEKANAKMLLGIRGLLTSDQWTKLQAERTVREQQSQRNLKEMMERMQHGRDTLKLHTTHPPAKPDGSLVLPALPNMPELTLAD